MIVTLPWPPKELSPNVRCHWRAAHAKANVYKQACFVLTIAERIKIDWSGPIHVAITFYPPDRRYRDDDNMIASLKYGRDGVAQALGVDDKRFRIHPEVSDELGGFITLQFSKDRP